MLSKSAIEGFLAELSAPADTSETEIRKEQFKKEKGGGGGFADVLSKEIKHHRETNRLTKLAPEHQDKQTTEVKFKSLFQFEAI